MASNARLNKFRAIAATVMSAIPRALKPKPRSRGASLSAASVGLQDEVGLRVQAHGLCVARH